MIPLCGVWYTNLLAKEQPMERESEEEQYVYS
jgi:hypothetical protein